MLLHFKRRAPHRRQYAESRRSVLLRRLQNLHMRGLQPFLRLWTKWLILPAFVLVVVGTIFCPYARLLDASLVILFGIPGALVLGAVIWKLIPYAVPQLRALKIDSPQAGETMMIINAGTLAWIIATIVMLREMNWGALILNKESLSMLTLAIICGVVINTWGLIKLVRHYLSHREERPDTWLGWTILVSFILSALLMIGTGGAEMVAVAAAMG